MEQSITSTEEGKEHGHFFYEKELEACEILLNLEKLIAEDESRKLRLQSLRLQRPGQRQPFLVRWASRKVLRSPGTRMGSCPSANLPTTPPKPPSPLIPLQNKSQHREVKVDATSPDTPLSFSTANESDDKLSQSHLKKFNKRKREALLETIKGLAECRELLRKEVENVTNYYNQLLAFNRELKANRQRVESTGTCQKREEPSLEVNKSLTLGLNCVQSQHIAGIPHQKPFIVGPRAMESPRRPEQLRELQSPNGHGQVQVRPNLFSSSSGMGNVNHMGPLRVPDLNVPTEGTFGVASYQPLEYTRVFADNRRIKAAEARRIRILKNQQKVDMKIKLKGVSGTGVLNPPLST